ncbi:MAG: DNA repair protein RecN [Tannerellaceae bacterium]|jgi:DNA repair protein RecN (Recombination protein N)|nr:DNA repair protein RecN [Tannerellaceae bacterium]
MLSSLTIRNYVLIERLDIRFGKGLSVVTGETGAGKSIILGALGLVLGQRADGKSIRSGADKCVVEAVFDISDYGLSGFFAENDLEYDAEHCILRRELFASGKSRAFVNDSPIQLSVLKELGNRLIDIHSQHGNLLLGDSGFQLRVVDVMAGNGETLSTYRTMFNRYRSLQQEWEDLTAQACQTKQDEEFLRSQQEQLAGANLTADEQEALEDERSLLSHAEDIKAGLYKITGLLQDDDSGLLRPLKEALSAATALRKCYPKAESIAERLHSAYADLSDLAMDTSVQQENVAFDSGRLAVVNERLDILYGLQQKYHVATVAELIGLREDYERRLREMDSFDERLERLRHDVAAAQAELLRQAALLHESRRKAGATIAKSLVAHLAALGMPNARLEVSIETRTEPVSDGMDEVRFLFAAHRNVPLQSVAQTASGGELSRLMLCIKAMIAGFTALPTIIFDEADTGVSGDIADKTGEIMQEMSRSMQVITITHLPQIAAKGLAHYLVYKEDTPERTVTGIRPLDGEERLREIARMLSGASLTEASIANARELLRPVTPPAGDRRGSAA